MVPAGMVSSSCSESAYSGLGKRVNRPSFSIADAPPPPSSAGWPIMIKVPCHCERCSAMRRAVPAQADMCKSCPQACITLGILLANGSPVFSSTGNASQRGKAKRLHHKLADNSSPARTHGEAYRDLFLPACGPSQQEIGKIGASDQKHHSGNRHQYPERRGKLTAEI